MHPLAALAQLRETYQSYIKSFQFYRNPSIGDWVERHQDKGRLSWREPFLTLASNYLAGTTFPDLVKEGLVHPDATPVFAKKPGNPTSGPIDPRWHQEQAVRIAADGSNYVVTTGTGSGKSFCFYIPIVSDALTIKPPTPAFRSPMAVIVYPMNALANSQYEDMATRLAGSGLTICNYTGDLPRTHEDAMAKYADLYGRPTPFDAEVIDRQTLHDEGTDILLTNFKMLEYALLRGSDAMLFKPPSDGGRLRWLVLDEMHTYSGRQGADMAMLVRRLTQRTGTAGTLRCVGTSATVDSDPTKAAQTVADFAGNLFNAPFHPTHVIGDRFAEPSSIDPTDPTAVLAATAVPQDIVDQARELDDDIAVLDLLGPLLCNTKGVPTVEQVRSTKMIGWIERLLRDATVQSINDLVDAYKADIRPAAEEAAALADIEAALMVGAAIKVPGPRGDLVGLLTPKAHGFFSQGLPVTACAWAPTDAPHLSEVGDSTCPTCANDGRPDVPTFPMVFCQACGVEYLVAGEDDLRWTPLAFLDLGDGVTPVYLTAADYWDPDETPIDPSRLKKTDGQPRKGQEGFVPRRVTMCGQCGSNDPVACGHADPRDMVRVSRPLGMCCGCGVEYDGSFSEYNKFFQVGTVGRATATDVLVSGLLGELEGADQKVMAFSDNQQDTSFQTAHLNSLSRRFHLRRALVAGLTAVAATGVDDAISVTEAGKAAYEAMKATDTVPTFTRAMDSKQLPSAKRKAVQRAEGLYQRYLTAGVLMEASGNPRKTQPNLEDTGLLRVTYEDFDEPTFPEDLAAVIRDDGYDALTELPVELAIDLLRVMLDTVRRALAIDGEADTSAAKVFSDGGSFARDVLAELSDEVQFHGSNEAPFRYTVFSDTADSGRGGNVRRLAGKDGWTGTSKPVRWLIQEAARLGAGFTKAIPDDHDDEDVTRKRVKAIARGIVQQATRWLADYGYLVEAGSHVKGYAVAQEKILCWLTEDEQPRCPRCSVSFTLIGEDRSCPRCIKTTLKAAQPHAWDYFRSEYRAGLDERPSMLAAEHTGAIDGDYRKEIEKNFRADDHPLNVVVCTPTMELGVDIGSLAAVHMRNVPPSPANYAQRQGRAGRASQPSIVTTFCGSQGRSGPHDQYFFRFPHRMIAGKIAAPRFNVDNEALVRAHMNSVIIGAWNNSFYTEPNHVWLALDPDDTAPGELDSDWLSNLTTFITTNTPSLITQGEAIFDGILGSPSVPGDFIVTVVNGFVDAFRDEWRALGHELRQTQDELATIQSAQQRGESSSNDQRRADSLTYRIRDIREGSGDYYALGWLSQRAFLPTYAFPRKAVTLRLAEHRKPRIRGHSVALREFAPRNFVYHRGSRFEVVKATLAPGASFTENPLSACGNCGHYLLGADAKTATACPKCGTAFHDADTGSLRMPASIELPSGFAVKRETVGADAEDRRRQGYDIRAAFRLNDMRTTRWEASGATPFDLAFGAGGRLLQANIGLFRSDEVGFSVCLRCREWSPSDDHFGAEKDCGERADNLLERLIIHTEADHDMIVLDTAIPDDTDSDTFAHSLMYALTAGISVRFGIDESEIDGRIFPHPTLAKGKRILIYEMDEGGIGVLERIRTEWDSIVDRALEVLHIDPATGITNPDACDSSCYECLRSFYNQFHHDHLDRTVAGEWLIASRGATFTPTTDQQQWDTILAGPDGQPKFASATEQQLVEAIRRAGIPAPTHAHHPVPSAAPIAEADLYYESAGTRIVVFLDGAVHDEGHLAKADGSKRDELRSLGYKVIEIRYDEPDGIKVLAEALA